MVGAGGLYVSLCRLRDELRDPGAAHGQVPGDHRAEYAQVQAASAGGGVRGQGVVCVRSWGRASGEEDRGRVGKPSLWPSYPRAVHGGR
jgi:hypothetical protein